MKRLALWIVVLIAAAAFGQSAPKRPKITGIDHVDFYTTDAAANEKFYAMLGLESFPPVEPGQTARYAVKKQWIGYSPAPDRASTNRMDHVAFRTDDCEEMRRYLKANGVAVPQSVGTLKLDEHTLERAFKVKDPEGHVIEFVQPPTGVAIGYEGLSLDPVSRRLIHAGFIVRDRAAEDHFYKDILGFHLYWYGGMHPERTEWVAMQVPDGTDWVEYMLNQPANPDRHLEGVMDHISLGVADIKAAQAKLEAHGWKEHGEEHAQMGKDGKWQLNLYDPDQTRIELMEFTPKEKPCCSEFQGTHPSEND